ncbi:hypothetical protein M885DRAFT_315430 [Pelagophyceae sp. CCMP2097]|nr:hypothetical protein M885DRAFT_315430 [Pelagophyceae sp. CCMP2097]
MDVVETGPAALHVEERPASVKRHRPESDGEVGDLEDSNDAAARAAAAEASRQLAACELQLAQTEATLRKHRVLEEEMKVAATELEDETRALRALLAQLHEATRPPGAARRDGGFDDAQSHPPHPHPPPADDAGPPPVGLTKNQKRAQRARNKRRKHMAAAMEQST